MLILERLKLELNNKPYFDNEDEVYTQFLDENDLDALDDYSKSDRIPLLETVYTVLQTLANDLDIYRKVHTEFSDESSAYANLGKRLTDIRKEIDRLKVETTKADSSSESRLFAHMYYNYCEKDDE